MMKYNLIEMKGFSKHQVKIDWEKGLVKVKGMKIASVSEEAKITCESADYTDVKASAVEGVKEWLSKKGRDADDFDLE